MKPSVEHISNLLSARGNAQQDEGYWNDFLREFHHNQRQEEASQTAPAALFGRVSSWLSEVNPWKMAYGAGLAYAAATLTFFLIPRGADVDTQMPTAPVSHQVLPAPTLEQLEQLDLDPSSEGIAGEQEF